MQYLPYALLALVTVLQAADAYLTWRVLQGGGRELNPIVAFLMQKLGTVAGLAIVKLFLVVMAALFLLDYPVPLLGIVALYSWVVVHNWNQLQRASPAPRSTGK